MPILVMLDPDGGGAWEAIRDEAFCGVAPASEWHDPLVGLHVAQATPLPPPAGRPLIFADADFVVAFEGRLNPPPVGQSNAARIAERYRRLGRTCSRGL